MRAVYGAAEQRAPALAARFRSANMSAADLVDDAALSRLPVLKKEELLERQRADPPFAGYLACDPGDMSHVYVSPGPIFEPSLCDDHTGHGMDMLFSSAGIGRGDLALNTWSYHLVPAGLLFDAGLRAVGATVIPAGTGNTELQADLLITLQPTVFLGSTAHFATVTAELESKGRSLPRDWGLKHAVLGGEFGDWSAKRKVIEDRFGLKTWSCYATADFGLIGYERPGESGYLIHEDRFVQICDPETGSPVHLGVPGEIVVTTLSPGWPMIRFGTGDVASAIELREDGGVDRVTPLQGRVGAAVKAREIFVYPIHVQELAARINGVEEARVAITRAGRRDEIRVELLWTGADDPRQLDDRVVEVFRSVTRLNPDHISWVRQRSHFTIEKTLIEKGV
jgi:phenylacetate-CoA ligase